MSPPPLEYPIIAIPDLHGQSAFLDRLVAKLRVHPVWPRASLVFLGDLVDRGPDVKGTVQRVIDLIAEKRGSTCVMGNHDFALLNATGLVGPAVPDTQTRPAQPDQHPTTEFWVKKYGQNYDHEATFRSYLGREPQYHSFADWLRDLDDLRAAIPESHREFLRNLPWVAEASGHLFLHNGLSRELNEPADIQLHALRLRRWADVVTPKMGTKTFDKWQTHYPVWLGADKSSNADPLRVPGKVQVLGHVKVDEPKVNAVRIQLDTTGGVVEPLTAAVFAAADAPPEFVTSN